MIIAYVGLLGKGKTLGMTAYGKQAFDEGKKILSNYKLSFGELVNPLELVGFEIERAELLLDEGYVLFDSRENPKAKKYLTYFAKQSRKREVNICYTTQRLMDVDVRLRQITEKIVLCNKYEGRGFLYTELTEGVLSGRRWLPLEEAAKIFPLYNHKQTQMSMDMQDEITTLKELKDIFAECPNMVSFITVVRTDNPYITKETTEAIYSLLKAGKDLLVEKLLRPYKKPISSFQPRAAI